MQPGSLSKDTTLNEKQRSATDAAPGLTIQFGDHLFLNQDSNKINDQHTGELPLPEYRKVEWRKIHLRRLAALDAMGIPFRFLLAPDKQTVYRHLLPADFSHRSASHLRDLPNVVDVAPILRTLSPFVDLYPQTDSHWNHLGAYIAAQAVLTSFGLPTTDVYLRWKQWETEGDLGRKLVPSSTSQRPLADYLAQSFLAYDNGIGNNGRVRVFSKPNPSPQNSTMLIFGDSFSYELVEFLKDAFDTCVQVHSLAVDMTLVEALRPTVVLAELTERFAFRLPSPADDNSLRTIWIEKLLADQKPVVIRTRFSDGAMPPHAAEAIKTLHAFGGSLVTVIAERLTEEGSLTKQHFQLLCDIALSSLLQPRETQDIETAERLAHLAFRAGERLNIMPAELPPLAVLGSVERSTASLDAALAYLGHDVRAFEARLPASLRPSLARALFRWRGPEQVTRCLLFWLKGKSTDRMTQLEAVALKLLDDMHPDDYPHIRRALSERLRAQPDGHRDAYLVLATRLARDGSLDLLDELLSRYVDDIDQDLGRVEIRQNLLNLCRRSSRSNI